MTALEQIGKQEKVGESEVLFREVEAAVSKCFRKGSIGAIGPVLDRIFQDAVDDNQKDMGAEILKVCDRIRDNTRREISKLEDRKKYADGVKELSESEAGQETALKLRKLRAVELELNLHIAHLRGMTRNWIMPTPRATTEEGVRNLRQFEKDWTTIITKLIKEKDILNISSYLVDWAKEAKEKGISVYQISTIYEGLVIRVEEEIARLEGEFLYADGEIRKEKKKVNQPPLRILEDVRKEIKSAINLIRVLV